MIPDWQEIMVYAASIGLIIKPVQSFWLAYIAPYIAIRPTEKLLRHPLYIVVAYLVDWLLRIKLPRSTHAMGNSDRKYTSGGNEALE